MESLNVYALELYMTLRKGRNRFIKLKSPNLINGAEAVPHFAGSEILI